MTYPRESGRTPTGRFRAALLPLLALLAIVPARSARCRPLSPPDTPEGRRLSAFLAALNAGQEPVMRSFIETNFSARDLQRLPVGPRLNRLWSFARAAAPVTLEKLLGPGAALVRSSRTGRWYEVRLELDTDAARSILGIDFDESDAGAAEPPPEIHSDEDLARAADARLTQLAAEDRFSGVVLLARSGKPFFEKAYGWEDRERRVSNTVSTRFNIGSINKIFTQVAIAQLAAAGRLSLSDTVHTVLPDVALPSADRITLLQLVNMTSGLGDIFNDRYDAAAPHLRTLSDYLKLFADRPLLFSPGSDRRYSNAGYIVLGLVVEKVSGQSYHDYVRDHVFAPAKMTSSGPGERVRGPGRAIGYTREGDGGDASAKLHPNTGSLPARSSSAGGGDATARDLLAFEQALSGGKLLSPEWTAWIYSDKTDPRPRAASSSEPRRLGIAGGTPGANAILESGVAGTGTIVVLANLDPPAAERLARMFRGWMGTLASARGK